MIRRALLLLAVLTTALVLRTLGLQFGLPAVYNPDEVAIMSRALAFAKATRPNVLEGVYVGTDPDATQRLMQEWDDRNLGVPLKVLYSPYREIVRPIIEYATQIREASPRGVVAVYIPEYVVGRWWEQLLHNQTALRLKGRLLFTPGVMVTSVPYQLQSSQIARDREERELARVRAGDLRRGRVGRSPDKDRQVPR